MSLAERKQFIAKNKHLPWMPSEAEVLKNGANVSEVITGLLQNVEELTLYVLQLEEKIKQLEAK